MAAVKTYRPYAPEQSYLLPPSPGEWLPKGHLAYFILDLVTELDLGEIERRLQAKDHRGERPYSPPHDNGAAVVRVRSRGVLFEEDRTSVL